MATVSKNTSQNEHDMVLYQLLLKNCGIMIQADIKTRLLTNAFQAKLCERGRDTTEHRFLRNLH